MQALTTIKTTQLGEFLIYRGEASSDDLIATASKKEDGQIMICIYGGIAHGKIAYASDFQDLNDKSVEIANLPKH